MGLLSREFGSLILQMEKFESQEETSQLSCLNKFIDYFLALNNWKLPHILVVVLICLQTLQIMSASIITPLNFKSLGLEYAKKIASLFYPDYYLRNSQLVLYFVPISFSITLFHILTFVFTLIYESRLKLIVHYLFILYNTIFTLPFMLVNASTIICYSNNPFSKCFNCYSSLHIFYVVLACINIGWIIASTFFFFVFYVDKNMLSHNFYATSSNLCILLKFAVKLSPVVYIIVDPILSFAVLYSIGFAGITLAHFALFKIMWPYFRSDQYIENISIRCQIITIFVTAFLISLHFFTNDDSNIVFLASLILSLGFGQFLIRFFQFFKGRLISIYLNDSEEEEIDQMTYLQFFYTLVYKVQKNQLSQIQIFDLVKTHNMKCKKVDCYCAQILLVFDFQKQKQMSKQIVYYFINQLMMQAIEGLKKCSINLILARSYIAYFKLNEKTKSIFTLSEILKSNKIGLSEQICIRKLFKQYKNLHISETDLNKFSEFSILEWNFQRVIERSVINCDKYWAYLLEQQCEVSKVWKLANIVQHDKQVLDNLVVQMLKLYENHLYTLQLYTQLLVVIYRAPLSKVQNYISIINLTQSRLSGCPHNENEVLFRKNEDVAVMCSAEFDGVFQYIRVSGNIINVLSVRSTELIKKNVSCILPEVYQEFHDLKIKQYGRNVDDKIPQRNGNVYLIDKVGKMVNCIYKTKIMPSLTSGIELACFIRLIKPKNQKKLKYLAYYFTKATSHEESQSQYCQGEIIHIDPQLKEILCEIQQEDEQLSENVKQKIEYVVPEWDIFQERVRQQSEGTSNSNYGDKIENVELIHSDALSQNVSIKYLAFTLTNRTPKLSMDFFEGPIDLWETKNRELSIKQSFWHQNSQQRINFIEKVHEKSSRIQKIQIKVNPIPVHPTYIQIFAAILLAIYLVLCVIPFSISPSYLGIAKHDFTTIQLLNEIDTLLYGISLSLYKNIKDMTVNQNLQIIHRFDLERINSNVKQIYSINGIQNINAEVSIFIPNYSGTTIISSSNNSFNDAVSFLLTAIFNLVRNLNDATSQSNLFMNLEAVFSNSFKIQLISKRIANGALQLLITRQIGFDSVQIALLLLISVAIIVRVVKIFQFSQITLALYQNSITKSHLQQFSKNCLEFLDKVRGKVMTPQVRKMQKLKLILTNLQTNTPLLQSKQSGTLIEKVEQYEDQEQKLIKLRDKITFVKSFHKLKHLFVCVFVFAAYMTAKLVLKFQILYNKDIQKRSNQNRETIKNLFSLNSQIERLKFNAAFSILHGNAYTQKCLAGIENRMIYISTMQDIEFKRLYKVMSELTSGKKYLSFVQMESIMIKRQAQIMKIAKNAIQKSYSSLQARRNAYFVCLEFFFAIVAILTLRTVFKSQENARSACFLMLNMIEQGQNINIQASTKIF